MKKLLWIILPLILILGSCDNDDSQTNEIEQNSIVGTWQLVERYADPGDGNGTWEPIENGKVVTINADGT
ncbi:MAG: hypothetical protein WBG46_03435 [Nonlabens sp.]